MSCMAYLIGGENDLTKISINSDVAPHEILVMKRSILKSYDPAETIVLGPDHIEKYRLVTNCHHLNNTYIYEVLPHDHY